MQTRNTGLFVYAFAVIVGLCVGVGCGPSPDVLLPEATARIRGLVLNTDLSRSPAAKVQLEPVGTPPCRFDTFTRVDGSYELEGICPGLYDIVAIGPGATGTRARVRFVQLSAGQTALIPDLVLLPAATVTGTVLLQGSASNAGVNVILVGTNRSAVSDAAGNFTIPNVEEGTYAVNFTSPGFIEQTISNFAVPQGVSVSLNVTPTLKPVNPSTTATIRGQVALETRTDASGIIVSVDGTDRSVVTTVGGFYEFPGLPISTYSLTFRKAKFFDKTIGPISLTPGQVLVVNALTQVDSHRVLNPDIPAFDIEHAPTGTQLIRATSPDAATGELGLTDPLARVFNTIITSNALATPFAGISWSPDAQDILFVRSFTAPANSSSIGTLRNDGTRLRNLLPPATQYRAPAWAPDGSKFAYFLNPDIRTIAVDRSTPSLVATTSTSAVIDTLTGVVEFSGMEWSATGRIYYSHSVNGGAGLKSAGLFTVFATGGGKLTITPRTASGLTISTPESPTLRPDFGRIAFSWRDTPSATEPPNGIYVMDLDGTNATRITTVPGVNLDWSPDGTRIVFTKSPTDTPHPNRIHEVLIP